MNQAKTAVSPLPYTGERFTPYTAAPGGIIAQAHLMRYAWVAGFVQSHSVCDLGCGAGYGSLMLKWAGAAAVVGVDIDETAVNWARSAFGHGIAYIVGDITENGLPNTDIYTAFEVLEHLSDPALVLDQLTGKKLFWSMPINDGSRFHVRPYTIPEILGLFPENSRIFYQNNRGHIAPQVSGMSDPVYVLGISRL